jgi:hypothetical protein
VKRHKQRDPVTEQLAIEVFTRGGGCIAYRLDPELGIVRLCPSCNEWWPDDSEFFQPTKARSRRPRCVACIAETPGRQRRPRVRNWRTEAERERSRRYYHGLSAERRRERNRLASAAYRARHPERVRELDRARYHRRPTHRPCPRCPQSRSDAA